MNPDILNLFFHIGKFIIAAALMTIFYRLLYREKTTFNHCRIYLLSIAFVSLLISQFNIVVYTPPARIVEIEASQAKPELAQTQNNANSQVSGFSDDMKEKFSKGRSFLELLTVWNIAVAIYGLVTFVLFISLFIQISKILTEKRKSIVIQKNGFEMVVSPDIPTPFSFLKSIFIGNNLSGNNLEIILKHEQWHIKHRHYVDVIVMEILVRLFWFNPVLWWVRKELRNISEFQADRSVLDEGHDLYKYQTLILEELMEHNPYLSNGFNNSFTKKRFIMMKNNYRIRFTTLRRAMILPFLAGVFSLLCFTTAKSEVKYSVKNAEKPPLEANVNLADTLDSYMEITVNEPKASDVLDSVLLFNESSLIFNLGIKRLLRKEEVDKAIIYCSKQLDIATKNLDRITVKHDFSEINNALNSVLKILDIKLYNGDASFDQNFLSSITQEELKTTSANFIRIKSKLDKLAEEKSTTEKMLDFRDQMTILLQEELLSRTMIEASDHNFPRLHFGSFKIIPGQYKTITSSQIEKEDREMKGED